jgi:phthiocerol/phenolphthiocerol synthesis type-I polyketide synthase E
VIHNFFDAKSITGIDLSAQAISFCTETHRYPGMSFLEGDAEHIPFKDGSFDVVTNIESSHSYPDIKAFYAEVFRILTKEGYFLYTDWMSVQQIREYVALLKDIGFIVERDQDITSNVLLSSDQIASLRMQAFGNTYDAQLMNEFLCLPGSYQYNEMAARESYYVILKLRKDARKA